MKSPPSIRYLFFAVLFFMLPLFLTAQKHKKHVALRDSLDHAFDLGDYLIENAYGFVPVPVIITEKALGGFGGGIVPVFIKPRPPYLDSVKGKLVKTPVAPDITGGVLAYTLNKTWIVDAFRSGTFIKSRIKYIADAGYANVNMSFYRTVGETEKEFPFNFKAIPVLLQATRRLGQSHWYAGLKYLFLKMDIQYTGDATLPDELDLSSKYSRIISALGAIVELDTRDNVFTPDKGIKFHVDAQCSDNVLGSDYDYWRMNYYMYLYKKIGQKLVLGWRVDGQQSFSGTPFFLLPSIDMRGIPAARYQGKADILTEVETRWDVTRRWSVMLYGGTGKAFDEWGDFDSADWVYSYGTGFRYMLARKFKLRVGIDVAKGPPGSWGYYIVFGSNWLK
jgi:hypothetical protein